jgi:hypothetical protein
VAVRFCVAGKTFGQTDAQKGRTRPIGAATQIIR